MKHAHPFIADAVARMAADGITEAVTLVLAPHYSAMSVGQYQKNADEAATAARGLTLWHVDSWHLHPKFLRLIESRVQSALARFANPDDVLVVFSAHSLPARIIAAGDPYERQLHETGDAVAAALHLPRHRFAWQSAGRTADTWLGPDILEVLRELAAEGTRQVVLCPVGFVSDHLEVLYDVDIEAQALARGLGVQLERTASLNADPAFIETLRDVVRAREVQAAAAGRTSDVVRPGSQTGDEADA
jgi:ferrochelatase